MSTSLDDAMVDDALGDLENTELSAAVVAALRLADVLTGDHPQVTAEMQAELREHYTDTQILELGSALAVASGWQRFIEAFGIRPDQWTTETTVPDRPTSSADIETP